MRDHADWILKSWGSNIRDKIFYAENQVQNELTFDLINPKSVIVVKGGPGTGKTQLISDLCVHRMIENPEQETPMVITGSSSDYLKNDLKRRIIKRYSESYPSKKTLLIPKIFSIFSLSFSIFEYVSNQRNERKPKIISANQQDNILHEILVGQKLSGGKWWPNHLNSALSTASFARTLRDFILRAYENEYTPEEIIYIGEKYNRHEWIGVGRTMQEYEDILTLQNISNTDGKTILDQPFSSSDLVSTAYSILNSDQDLLDGFCLRIPYLYVDNAQSMTLSAGKLISLLSINANQAVLCGDTNQEIFRWRGTRSKYFTNMTDQTHTINLDKNHRFSKDFAQKVNEFIGNKIEKSFNKKTTSLAMQTYSSSSKCVRNTISALQRAHLHYGYDYSQMAVITRGEGEFSEKIKSVLKELNIPFNYENSKENESGKLVLALISSIKILDSSAEYDDILNILSSPFFENNQILIDDFRGIYANNQETNLTELITNTKLKIVENSSIYNIKKFIEPLFSEKLNIYQSLWMMWNESNVHKKYLELFENNKLPESAIEDINEITIFFKTLNIFGSFDYPNIDKKSLLNYFLDFYSQNKADLLANNRNVKSEGISLLSAHSAVGRSWKIVAIVGVQEGLWPNPKVRNDLLGTNDFVELTSTDENVNIQKLGFYLTNKQQEEATFYVALTRAEDQVIISAVDNPDGNNPTSPSKFYEIMEKNKDNIIENSYEYKLEETLIPKPPIFRNTRTLSSWAFTQIEKKPDDIDLVNNMKTIISLLKKNNIKSADFNRYYKYREITKNPNERKISQVRLSPSKLSSMKNCGLSFTVEPFNLSTQIEDMNYALIGNIVHTAALALASGINLNKVKEITAELWLKYNVNKTWEHKNKIKHILKMIENVNGYFTANFKGEHEKKFSEIIGSFDINGKTVQIMLSGRLDYVENGEDKIKVVDIKTSKKPISYADASEDLQLLAYRVLVSKNSEKIFETTEGILFYPSLDLSAKNTRVQNWENNKLNIEESKNLLIDISKTIINDPVKVKLNSKCRICFAQKVCPLQKVGEQL